MCRGFVRDLQTGFGLDDWIYWHFIHTTWDYTRYSAIADLHTLHFTVTHALSFWVFTSHILATDFIRVCHFKSHTKSSFHSLIPFLPLLCNCPLNSKLISWQACISKLDSSLNDLNWTLLYNRFAWTTQKTQPLYCWEGMFTVMLHSNRSYSTVACKFVATGMCL
jgi:hypothetical protein